MNRIPIALFPNHAQAEPIRERLERAGVPAEIHEELGLQKFWFVSRQAAGVRVEVALEQFDQAERLLRAWDMTEGALHDAIRCPECKSLLVDYPQFARNSIITNLAAGLIAELGLVEKDYYCEHCHYTWPKEPKEPKEQKRAHLAPYYFIEDVPKPVRYQPR